MSAPPSSTPVVLVVGDITVDILARIDAFAGAGGDFLVPRLEHHCGGVGGNVALALAKWGVPVRLVGCTGRDWFGNLALSELKRGGVEVSFVQQTEQALTGLFFIAISADGQRTMFGSRGANELLGTSGNWICLDKIGVAHFVGYTFLKPPAAEHAKRLLDEAGGRGVEVSLDVGEAPSRQIPQAILSAARKANILFATLEEATVLTGESDARDAFCALEQAGAREVVLKLGERGCVYREQNEIRECPAFAISAVDTTGAGDAFAAGFLRARRQGWSRAEASLLANAAGAAASCVVGAGEAMPAPRQIVSLLRASRLPGAWEPVRGRILERLSQEMEDTD